MSSVRAYRNIPASERKLLREAVRKMYYCKMLLRLYSFKKIADKYRVKEHSASGDHDEIVAIRKAVRRSDKLATWRNRCLVNTLVARSMLSKRGIASTAFLGVKKEASGKMVAHAWLIADGIEVTPKGENYTVLHQF